MTDGEMKRVLKNPIVSANEREVATDQRTCPDARVLDEVQHSNDSRDHLKRALRN
jgi:hypothetical protein